MIASSDSDSSMLYHIPMSSARLATGRRYSQTNLRESIRISAQLLRRAKNGASGKAHTNSVTKPYWITATHQHEELNVMVKSQGQCVKSTAMVNHYNTLSWWRLQSEVKVRVMTDEKWSKIRARTRNSIKSHTHLKVFSQKRSTLHQVLILLPPCRLLLLHRAATCPPPLDEQLHLSDSKVTGDKRWQRACVNK